MRKQRNFLLPMLLVLLIMALVPGISGAQAPATDLIITGVVDGPLTGGIPKAVEFYALNDIADLSSYGFGSANNGGGTDGQEFTFPADSVTAGTFIYVASETTGFNTFFGFAPNYTSSAASINGDDAIELFHNSAVVDVFGDINVDGTGQPWEYKDGWAYRVDGTGPDGSTFVLANWSFSGPNALDNETDNATATTPFPIGTFGSGTGGGSTAQVIINEVDADQAGTDSAEFIELYDGGVGNTDLGGLVLVLFNGSSDTSYASFDLDGQSTTADGYFVLCANAATVPNCDMDVSPDTNLIQNGADAVALYTANATDFPSGTAVTTANLLDALVYDTADADDPGLLTLLNPGEPQVDERGGGDGTAHSNQRCANGEGGARNTSNYTQALPTPGAANNCGGGGGGGGALICGAPATLIHDIQGNGFASPMLGATGVTIEGVVVGDFQDTATQLRGFFVQEEDTDVDADPATSEGIFVFDNGFGVDVNVGDVVRLMGDVTEYYDMTELTGVSAVEICSNGAFVTPATVTLPVSAITDFESFEGMLVNFPQQLTTTEHYNLGRYGQVDLSLGRLLNPTQIVAPGASALAMQDLNDRSRIILDDANTSQNRDPILYPDPGLSASNPLRTGYTVDNLTAVLEYRYGAYRLQPVSTVAFNADNPRPAAPDAVGGTLKVASFNVLNYFNGDGLGGGFPTPRGADTPTEFTRQRDKIISAILALDADVVGLMEIENDGYAPTSAIADLVNGLNAIAGAGTFAYIDPGVPQIGTDAIAVGLIYKPASVTPVGSAAILDSSVDPTFIDTKNRPSLAQTFQQNGVPEAFTVVVNHLKSKGSPCDSLGDPNTGDGQGNCNLTRTAAATALTNWLATDPTGSGDPDFLLIGDMNSYAMEDPITAFKTGGFANLLEDYLGLTDYSYVYKGQFGTLDYALANNSLAEQVTGVTLWHINADEPRALDYNEEYKSAGQIASLYNADPFRASDHDPVLVGLDLDTAEAEPGDFVVLGTEGVWLRNGSRILAGLVGVNDVSTGPYLNRPAEVVIDRRVTFSPGTGIMGNRLLIKKYSTIYDVYYNELNNKSRIHGTETTPVRMPLVNSMPAVPTATPGTTDVVVRRWSSASIDAGDYGKLRVKRGARLTFTGGVYNFSEWKIDRNATIYFTAPTEIRIAGRLAVNRRVRIMPAPPAGLSGGDVIIYVLGENGNVNQPRANPKAASIGSYTLVRANLYVPNGTLWMRRNAKGDGAFIGKWVWIDFGVEVNHHPAF